MIYRATSQDIWSVPEGVLSAASGEDERPLGFKLARNSNPGCRLLSRRLPTTRSRITSAWRTVNSGSNRKSLLRGLEAIVACVPARGREDGYSVVVEAQEGPLGNSLLAVEIEARPNGPEVERVGGERRFERVDRLVALRPCWICHQALDF